MALNTLHIGSPKLVTASGNVKASSGAVLGIFVSSHTTGSITLYDDAAAGTTNKILDTFLFPGVGWYPMNMAFVNGLNIVVGGTLSATVVLA